MWNVNSNTETIVFLYITGVASKRVGKENRNKKSRRACQNYKRKKATHGRKEQTAEKHSNPRGENQADTRCNYSSLFFIEVEKLTVLCKK